MKAGISLIGADDIERALGVESRQYLMGSLSRPQPLAHLDDQELEVGISTYPHDKVDSAHMHPIAREYQLMLAGQLEILDLGSGEVTRIQQGDFYVIERGTAYVQKVWAGTRVLFFKFPGVNDKKSVELGAEALEWLGEFGQ